MKDRVGAGWLKKGKDGQFVSISLELDNKKYKLVMFKNKFKNQDNHPDYNIYVSEWKNDAINTDDISF